MTLKKYTDEELEAELKRRQEEKKNKALTPKLEENMKWHPLVTYITECVDVVKEEGYEPRDFDHHVFEMAMEIVYGEDVWETYNKLL